MSFQKTRKDNVFTESALGAVESSRFDLSHEKKFTFNMGELIPVCCMECLPGDDFSLSYVNLIRFAPMIAPVMHKVRVKTEYFFVPNRILFDGWEDFITGVGTPVAAPYITLNSSVVEGTILDYLGIPPGQYTDAPLRISPLQMAAYYKIYDDWYRDQNLQTEQYIDVVPGDNQTGYGPHIGDTPLLRAWEHDYFTSALPTSQQGADVEIPLTFQDNIPVTTVNSGNQSGAFRRSDTNAIIVSGAVTATASALNVGGIPAYYDDGATMVVDVQSDAASINDLREAWSLQAFLERTIRGGQRYIEQIFAHFKEKSSDARLQRPELIGRNVQNLTIGEVLATAQNTDDGIAVGSLAGHGISVGGSDTMHYHCEEHGFIIGLISVVPDTSYQDGLHRQFTRFDRLDYAWPSFAHIGEQEIRNKEIMCHDIDALIYDPEGTFGYIPRYSEYRYIPSSVAGDFRSTLAFWTLGRRFDGSSPPELNHEFIRCFPNTDIFAVVSEADDHIYAQVINDFSAVRKLPRYGVPSTLT